MTRQGFARHGLAMPPCKLRPILRPVFGLALGGIALTLLSVGGAPTPASARGMGGFGHMGGMGNGGGMGNMSMGHSMGPAMHAPIVTRRGTGTYSTKPPTGTRYPGKGNANGDGNRTPPYHHPVIGHPIIVPIPGGGTPPVANIPATPPKGPTGFTGGGGGGGAGAAAGAGAGGGGPRWRHAAGRRAALRA